MSTPNPLAPQGSLLEKHGRGRSTFQIISFIGAIHVVALCGLLWIGCKKDDQGTGLAGNTDAAGSGLGALPGDPGLPIVGGAAAAPTNPPLPGYTTPALPTNAYYGGPVTGVAPGAGSGGAPAGGIDPVTGAPTGAGPGGAPAGGIDPVTGAPIGAAPAGGVDAGGTAAQPTEYKVQKGDIGTTIARKHGVSLAALKAANPTIDWNRLKVSQVIALPAKSAAPSGPATGSTGSVASAPGAAAADDASTYTVRPGDTGSRIAKKFGVSWKAIRTANNLSSDVLRPNQKLTIPAKGATATAPATNPPSGGAGSGTAAGPTATPLPAVPGQ